jgi:hypothetical protein
VASGARYRLFYSDEAKAQLQRLPGLTRNDRNSLFLRIHNKVKRLPDSFRDDPKNRMEPGSTELVYPLIFPDGNGDLLTVLFVIDVRPAEYGVLNIISVQLAPR